MNFDIATIKSHIESAKQCIHDMFETLLSKNTDKDNKRAHLVSYWLKDYSSYILTEDRFNPASLIHYKRGNIVQVEFGYRVGSELGGRHYAVVIDNHNDIHSNTITVVPLKSLKDNYKPNRYSFILQKGVYNIYSDALNRKIIKLGEKMADSKKEFEQKIQEYKDGSLSLDEYTKYLYANNEKTDKIMSQINILKKHMDELDNLKIGTVVNVGQIITISKMRISNPKINSDSLYGLKLSRYDLDMLNSKLKKLYIYNDSKE